VTDDPADSAAEHWSVGVARTWLEESGYPLEARTARALKAAGGVVEQSRYYVDQTQPDTLRELDVLATFWQRGGLPSGSGSWHMDLRVIVECKESPNNPWVLFTTGDRWYRNHDQLATIEAVEHNGASRTRVARLLESPLLLYRDGPYAYRLDTSYTKKDSGNSAAAYNAVQQVMSSMQGVQNDATYEPVEREAGMPSLSIFVPVLVTTAPLVLCGEAPDGSPTLESVPIGLLVSRLRLEAELRSVWVVNADALDKLTDMVRATQQNMRLDMS
jgi:hypothetical protein